MNIYQNEYFSDKEWKIFQEQLSPAKAAFECIAKKYKVKNYSDVRWPAAGITMRKLFKLKQIKLSLNAKYLVDRKVVYELSESNIILFFNIYYKFKSHEVLSLLDVNQIQKIDLLKEQVEKQIERGGK
jgi:hypothetical protein